MGLFSWLFDTDDSSRDFYKSLRVGSNANFATSGFARPAPLDMSQDQEVLRRSECQMVEAGAPVQADKVGDEIISAIGSEIKQSIRKFEEAERERKLEEARKRDEYRERASDANDSTRYSISSGGRYSLAESDEVDLIRERVAQGRTFARKLVSLVSAKCDGHSNWCYSRAGVSRQLYSQIISSPSKQPSKRTVMQLAIGLQLNRGEAEVFLATAGYAFSPSSYEDQVFARCLERGIYNMFDVNALLVACNCEPVTIN